MNRQTLLQEFFETMAGFHRRIAASKDRHLAGLGLTRPQGELLYLLSHAQSMSVKDIAGSLNVSSSAATQLIDGLAKRDLVSRQTADDDRRQVKIGLSAAGLKQFSELRQIYSRRVADLVKELDDQELAAVVRAFRKIAKAQEKQATHAS